MFCYTAGQPCCSARCERRQTGAGPNRIVEPQQILLPGLDETFDLTPSSAHRAVEDISPRLAPEQVARLDWHNDVSRLHLDIDDALAAVPDQRSRNVVIRRLRRALDAGPQS